MHTPTHATETAKVNAMFVEASKAHQTLVLSGTVEAKQNAELAPLQSGVIAQLFVEVGDVVEHGQKLMQLDDKLAKLNLAKAKASLAGAAAKQQEAERLYQEVILLSSKQLVAETLLAQRLSDVEVARAEYVRLTAEIDQEQEVLRRHTLYAPFSGVIAYRHIDIGEWVTQTTQAFTLVEQDELRVRLAIPQEYLGQLAGANDVDVVISPDFNQALLGHSNFISAKLHRIVNVVNDVNRTVSALVGLPPQSALVAGMSVHAEITLPESEHAVIWLPKSAIKQHPDGGTSVFAVKNNTAQRILVKVVKHQGKQVAITGAPAEQLYVLTGIELLKNGDALKVTELQGDAL